MTLLPQFLHPTDRQAKGRTFQLAGARSLANELDEFACRLEQAEQELAKAGWRLNSETWRVAFGRPEAPVPEGDPASPGMAPESAPEPASPARIRWAVLVARIYDALPLLCPAGHRAKRGPPR
jgi:hypothetical protein